MDGILPVNKPAGISSYDVIREFKRAGKHKGKVGHAGTLDPFASGVLLLLLGKSTKMFDEVQSWSKSYVAEARLGSSSDSLDRDGSIVKQTDPPKVSPEEVRGVLKKYTGDIEQKVPLYSASKHKGKRMYEIAREGGADPLKKKVVSIHELELIKIEDDLATLRAVVSSGTYIRQLSYDVFSELGVESYLESLVRDRIGDIDIDKCVELSSLGEDLESFLIV